ncbi:MAG: ComEC/Rec2 family competence protein [Clostridia bacterium]|nr:ComEC/Rec2 family competence protein [Clostridia bacterium]
MLAQKKKFVNVRPAVIITAGLIMGIILGYAFAFINSRVTFGLLCLIISGLLLLLLRFVTTKIKGGIVLVSMVIIALLLGLFGIRADIYHSYKSQGKSTFSGVVWEVFSEDFYDETYHYSLSVKGDFLDNTNAKVYAKFSSKHRVYQGVKISFYGDFSLNDNLSDFSFSTDIYYSVSVYESTVEIGELNGFIPALKHRLLTRLEKFSPNGYSLAYALLTGETVYVPDAILQDYKNVSIAHLFAVSGLHVGLVYGLIILALKLIRLKPYFRIIVVSFILLCYVGFCGFSPSSMRAFIIILVRELAILCGLKPDSTSNLSISAFILLLINPSDLFNVGFLLSFSVYLGLILLATPLSNALGKTLPKFIAKPLGACIVSELVSFPILLDSFGACSIFGFLFNLAIIPLTAFLYPIILFSSMLLCLIPVSLFATVSELTFSAINFILGAINTNLFMVRGVTFFVASIPYYLFLYSFAGKFNISAKSYRFLRIILLIATIFALFMVNLAY